MCKKEMVRALGKKEGDEEHGDLCPEMGDGVDLNLEDHARIAHTATMPLPKVDDPNS